MHLLDQGVAWVFKKLGYISLNEHRHKMQLLDRQLKASMKKQDCLEHFFEKVRIYHGNYPCWKAQQEFREFVSNDQAIHNKDAIDDYLGRVVDETRKCMVELGIRLDHHWEVDKLEKVRGQREWPRVYGDTPEGSLKVLNIK